MASNGTMVTMRALRFIGAFLVLRDFNSWEYLARLASLLEERNVGGDLLLITLKCIPELRGEEFVFDAHANLRADEEHDDGKEEERQRGHHKASGEQDAEHGGVDRMAHEAIRSRHDELVIGAEAGINAPLASESAGARPGKE